MLRKKLNSRKGALFFTVDSMLAGLIFVLTVMFVLSFYLQKPVVSDVQTVSNAFTNYITTTTMKDFNQRNRYLYYDANEQQPDFTVAQKVAYLKNSGKISVANSFIANITNITIPAQYGIEYVYDGSVIFSRNAAAFGTPPTNISSYVITYYINDSAFNRSGIIVGPGIIGPIVGPKPTTILVWD